MIVLDTDILIDALAGVEPARSFVEEHLPTRRLATTAITRFELLAGSDLEDEESPVRDILRPLATLPLDREAVERAAELAVRLRRAGTPLPMADLAIAGICLELGASLATRNRRHFERVPELQLEELEGKA